VHRVPHQLNKSGIALTKLSKIMTTWSPKNSSVDGQSRGRLHRLNFLTKHLSSMTGQFYRYLRRQTPKDPHPDGLAEQKHFLCADPRFTLITSVIQRVMGVETALVHLTTKRHLTKSPQPTSSKFDEFLLELAGDLSSVIVIPNCRRDGRFHSSPLSSEPLSIQFYAGAPILMNGSKVGLLSIMDSRSRDEGQSCVDQVLLADFAALVADKLLASDLHGLLSDAPTKEKDIEVQRSKIMVIIMYYVRLVMCAVLFFLP
jgi:hypothetical protein